MDAATQHGCHTTWVDVVINTSEYLRVKTGITGDNAWVGDGAVDTSVELVLGNFLIVPGPIVNTARRLKFAGYRQLRR